MDMSRDMAAMTAQFVATVTMLFNTLASAFTQLSKMKWVPQQGWAYSGGDWTVAVMGNWGVFVETSKADFNLLFRELDGTPGADRTRAKYARHPPRPGDLTTAPRDCIQR